MLFGLPLALLLTAQAAAGTPQSTAPAPQTAAEQALKAARQECPADNHDPNSREIVICAERQDGYRLNPDIMEARREVRRSPGRPKTPIEKGEIDNCAVGPFPCQTAGIDLIAAGITAATMAARLAQGKEIGSMFVTDPHPDEYHLYLMAKSRREAEEAQAAAQRAKAKAAAESAAPAATRTAADPKVGSGGD